MYRGQVPGAGLITGIGDVHGRPVMVVANDPSVKGGTFHPVSVTKNLRALEIAAQCRLPCVHMVDSGGAFLPLQSDLFADRLHGGRIFHDQACMSASGIAQLAGVLGSCTAGGAYVPAMSDEVVIVENQGTLFLAGPPLVRASTGEVVSPEELGGGRVHATLSGVADHLDPDDDSAIQALREALAALPQRAVPLGRDGRSRGSEAMHDLARRLTHEEETSLIPVNGLLNVLLDAGWKSRVVLLAEEVRLVAGCGKVLGWPVDVLAVSGRLTHEAAEVCSSWLESPLRGRRPLMIVQDVDTGDPSGGPTLREVHLARCMRVLARQEVRFLTLIVRRSLGPCAWALGGRGLGPDFLFTWPWARVNSPSGTGEYDALHATARVWDDGLLEPERTRETLALSLRAMSC